MNTQSPTAPHDPPVVRYVSRRDLMARTGLSSTTIWRMVRTGALPAPTRISIRRVAWPGDVIDRWLAERAESGR